MSAQVSTLVRIVSCRISSEMRQEKPSGFEFRVGLQRDPVPAERDVVQLAACIMAPDRCGVRVALLRVHRHARVGRIHGRSTGERSDPGSKTDVFFCFGSLTLNTLKPAIVLNRWVPVPAVPAVAGSWYTNRSVYASRAGVKILRIFNCSQTASQSVSHFPRGHGWPRRSYTIHTRTGCR